VIKCSFINATHLNPRKEIDKQIKIELKTNINILYRAITKRGLNTHIKKAATAKCPKI